MALFLVATPLVVVGCGGGDDASTPGAGGEGGTSADAAEELGLDAGSESSTEASSDGEGGAETAAEGSVDSAGDAPVGLCSEPARSFWIYDLSVMPPAYKQIPATCQGYGDHSIIYVADDIWGTKMDAAKVAKVKAAFETATPADPARGIYDIATSTFGKPTDVDGNDRITLLYYKIAGYGGYQFDGFIRAEDMIGGANTNSAEVLYLDGVRNDVGAEYMLGVAAHEFEHMILLNNKQNEVGWLDETMAETSMIACGYLGDLKDWVGADFALNPTQSLTTEPPNFNYGAGFLFGGYLHERFGGPLFTAIVQEPSTGIAGIDKALAAQGKTDTFKTILADWAAANFLDLPTLQDGRFGYKAFDVPAMASTEIAVPALVATHNLEAYSSKYIVFSVTGGAGSTLKITLQSANSSGLAFRHAEYPDTDKAATAQVGSYAMTASDDTLLVPNVGGTITRVMLAAVETAGAPASFTISAALQ
jgi:hypothetical protein